MDISTTPDNLTAEEFTSLTVMWHEPAPRSLWARSQKLLERLEPEQRMDFFLLGDLARHIAGTVFQYALDNRILIRPETGNVDMKEVFAAAVSGAGADQNVDDSYALKGLNNIFSDMSRREQVASILMQTANDMCDLLVEGNFSLTHMASAQGAGLRRLDCLIKDFESAVILRVQQASLTEPAALPEPGFYS